MNTRRYMWAGIVLVVLAAIIAVIYFANVRVYVISAAEAASSTQVAQVAGSVDMTGEWARSVGGPNSWNNGNDVGLMGNARNIAQQAQRLCGGCSGVGLLPGNSGVVVTWKTKTPPPPAPKAAPSTAPVPSVGNMMGATGQGNSSGATPGGISLPSTVTGGYMGNGIMGGYAGGMGGLFWFGSDGTMSAMQAPKGP